MSNSNMSIPNNTKKIKKIVLFNQIPPLSFNTMVLKNIIAKNYQDTAENDVLKTKTNTIDLHPTRNTTQIQTERGVSYRKEHKRNCSENSIVIKQRANCAKILYEIITQLENSLSSKTSMREKLNKKQSDSNKSENALINKALLQLVNTKNLLSKQIDCIKEGIDHVGTIILQTNEYYNITQEDMNSHINARIDEVCNLEELYDLLSKIKKAGRCEDYELYSKINVDQSYRQLYEYSKQKNFSLQILKRKELDPKKYKVAMSIMEGDVAHPIEKVEEILDVQLLKHYQHYSKIIDQANLRKKEWEEEISARISQIEGSIKYHINIVESVFMPQLNSYTEFISSCNAKQNGMKNQSVILQESLLAVNKQIDELSHKNNKETPQKSSNPSPSIELIDDDIKKIKEEITKRKAEYCKMLTTINELKNRHKDKD